MCKYIDFCVHSHRSQHYSLLQEEPPDMMTGPSPNDYYKEYIITYVLVMYYYPHHNRSDISSVPTSDIIKQQFSIPEDSTIQDARYITRNVIAIWKMDVYYEFK